MVLCSVTSCRSSGAKAFFPACLNWSLCPQVLLIWENQKAANWQSSSTLPLWWHTSTLHWTRKARCIILLTVREKRNTNYSTWVHPIEKVTTIGYSLYMVSRWRRNLTPHLLIKANKNWFIDSPESSLEGVLTPLRLETLLLCSDFFFFLVFFLLVIKELNSWFSGQM